MFHYLVLHKRFYLIKTLYWPAMMIYLHSSRKSENRKDGVQNNNASVTV